MWGAKAMQDSSQSGAAGRTGESILGGKYRIERIIGEGAFGRVYLAQDVLLRRNVAIKELLATRTGTKQDDYDRYLDRFEREARAAGRIEHPNIVSVYELAVDAEQNYYLVMQYVDGTNIRDLLVQVGSLPVGRAAGITLDVARALEAIHEQEIVHRDIKPANIMLTRRGVTKLTDFGIAQVGNESQRTQIVTGHPGTPMYMSPEQASGTGYLDGRSDIYSLGAVFYEMLTGAPYVRKRQPVRAVLPEISSAVGAIVDRMLAPDPSMRYQSATDLISDLERLSNLPATPTDEEYRMPGSGLSSGSQPPITGGWPVAGSISTPAIAPPPAVVAPAGSGASSQSGSGAPWYPQPPPLPPQTWPQQTQPPRASVPPAASRYLRRTVDGYGAARYEIATGRIALRTLGATGIAVALRFMLVIVLAIVSGAVGENSPVYDVFVGIVGIGLVLLPVVPFVAFFTIRRKAKRTLAAMTYGTPPR
jgi:serine/threonine protein kinase